MDLNAFDAWLELHGPVAVTIQEELEPVMGKESVFFPPTFAPPEGSKESPGYVIDPTSAGRVALVDTVGSQANRMEPLFKQAPYSELVPEATVTIGSRQINVLDAGHRAADAVVRFSDQSDVLSKAFRAIKNNGDATSLAKLAPTSLVFGVWDSRDTQVKLPRLVGSTIRAYNVEPVSRSAQFFTKMEKDEREELGMDSKALSDVGLNDAPAGRTPGGIIARDGIRRQAILNLVALRALSGRETESTRKLQRYILGLALIALTAPFEKFLREGCLLVPTGNAETLLVARSGQREPFALPEGEALSFAQVAAASFGVGQGWTAAFDKGKAKNAAKKGKKE